MANKELIVPETVPGVGQPIGKITIEFNPVTRQVQTTHNFTDGLMLLDVLATANRGVIENLGKARQDAMQQVQPVKLELATT